MDSGVATRPIADIDAYREQPDAVRLPLGQQRCSRCSRPRSSAPKRVVYAEGEDERVLRAVQVVVDEGIATPMLIGRPDVIAQRIRRARPAARRSARDCEGVNILDDPRLQDDAADVLRADATQGRVAPQAPDRDAQRAPTLIAAMLVRQGEADAMLCGTFGSYRRPPAATCAT